MKTNKHESKEAVKKPGQFCPMLKQMLGFYRYGPIPLLLWFLSCGIVLFFGVILSPSEWMRAHNGGSAGDANFLSFIALWGFLMLVATPLPIQLFAGATSLEFIFTRAVDRALWLRAERMAVVIIALGPLIINLTFLPLQRELAFEPAAADSPGAKMQARYTKLFSESHLTKDTVEKTPQLIIPHAAGMFAVWMIWLGLTLIFLVAAYYSVVYTAWQRAGWHHSKSRHRNWLGAAMGLAPTFFPVLILFICFALHFNVAEECFLHFAAHPICWSLALIAFIAIVQPMTERNIKKLEFEFT